MPKPWEMSPEDLRTEAGRLLPSWEAADEEASYLFLLQLSVDPDEGIQLVEDEESRDAAESP